MSQNTKSLIVQSLIFVKQNPQIIFSLALIILIPTLFFVFSALILNITQKQFDRHLQQNAVSLAKTIETFIGNDISSDLHNQKEIQNKILKLVGASIWLEDIAVFIPRAEQGIFFTIASFNPKAVNKEVRSTDALLAWQTGQTIAVPKKDLKTGVSYWLSSTPLKNDQNKVVGILSIALSRAEIEQVIQKLSFNLYGFSLIFSLILILFVANHARLFQYAVLLMKLRELDQAKDEFISTVSHELRTPLTTIRGYLSLIQEGTLGALNDQLKKGIDIVMLEVKRLYDLVEDLLEVSRIEQGRLSIEKELVVLNDFIKNICDELSIKAKEKSLELKFIDSPERLTLHTDKNRLKQIVVNLIGNSIKYTLSGFIEVGLLKESKDFIAIYVKDTGIGISAPDQEKLFTKFFRVQSEQTAKITGTGLGLWITKKITEALGGKIYLESIKGQGSKFTLLFPFK